MKQSDYKSYDELPLFLNADTVAKVLGIAVSSAQITKENADLSESAARYVVIK